MHQGVLHIFLYFGYQMYPVHEELLEQVLSDVAPIGEYLPEHLVVEGLVLERLSVVHIALCNEEVDDLPPFIDDDVKFEPKEPRPNGTGGHPILPLPFSAIPLKTLFCFSLLL